ncbi:MAG: hypothetical protein JNL01_06125 [Bdellovibrionales bacterium]|nr:hypothetical protein [Bdellovibrionales bacterium]
MNRNLVLFMGLALGLIAGPAHAHDQMDDDLEVDLNAPSSNVDELPPEPKPSPTPLTEDELAEWEIENKIPMSRRKKLSSWPGTFAGVRISYLMGASTVPKLGLGSELNTTADLPFRAPHIGIDLGYTPRYSHWGIGFSFDLSAGMPKLDYLKSSPIHGVGTIYANYSPYRTVRWVFGVNVLSQTQLVYFGGQTLRMQGFGFRGGVHFRSTRTNWKAFEVFAHAGWNQLTNISAGFGENQANYDPRKFLGQDVSTFNVWGVTGVQYNFQFKEKETRGL